MMDKMQFGVEWLKAFGDPSKAQATFRTLRSHEWSQTNSCEPKTAIDAIVHPSGATPLSYWIAQEVLFHEYFLGGKVCSGWVGMTAKRMGIPFVQAKLLLAEILAEATALHVEHMGS